MSIDAGFNSYGFTDDRDEAERWGLLEEKLISHTTGALHPQTKPQTKPQPSFIKEEKEEVEIDGKMDIGDTDWLEDAQKISVKEYRRKKHNKKQSFYQRNKKQIFDALIVLGVIYVGYKLLFEKEEGLEEGFEDGGDIDYSPPPPLSTPIAAPITPAPPRPELPEATYNPEG